MTGPAGLRDELQEAQFLAPPGEGPLAYDAGLFFLAPDGTDPDAELLVRGRLPVLDGGGKAVWPLTLFEDAETRETVFLSEAGEEILRQPPPPDYCPGWILELLYPVGNPPAELVAAYDPARVVMEVRLLVPVGVMENGIAEAPDGVGKGSEVPQSRSVAAPLGRQQALSARGCGGGPAAPAGAEEEGGAARLPARSGCRTWYVDSDWGDDANDGSAPSARGERRGPKASVQNAIDVAESGDVIEICGKAALPDAFLHPKGKWIRLRPQGNIRF